MKFIYTLFLSLLFMNILVGQEFIPLWNSDQAPNSKGTNPEHREENRRITQVSQAGIYAFYPSKEENKGSAVLICPSGGYEKLTYDIAGFQLAKWLNTLGINAFVLIYRLPNSPDLIQREKAPVQDAQRAMKLIRANSNFWRIDSTKIGIMGASAGGHLASILGTHREDFSLVGDSLDKHQFFPDFLILISPVINMGKYTHEGSRKNFLGDTATEQMIELYSNELHVSGITPPTFLVHAQNDKSVSAMNSILFYRALMDFNISGSLHIFPKGGHSIALRNNPGSTNTWTVLCEAWMKEMRIIE